MKVLPPAKKIFWIDWWEWNINTMRYCEYKSFKTPHELREFVNENSLIEVLSIIKDDDKYLLFYKK